MDVDLPSELMRSAGVPKIDLNVPEFKGSTAAYYNTFGGGGGDGGGKAKGSIAGLVITGVNPLAEESSVLAIMPSDDGAGSPELDVIKGGARIKRRPDTPKARLRDENETPLGSPKSRSVNDVMERVKAMQALRQGLSLAPSRSLPQESSPTLTPNSSNTGKKKSGLGKIAALMSKKGNKSQLNTARSNASDDGPLAIGPPSIMGDATPETPETPKKKATGLGKIAALMGRKSRGSTPRDDGGVLAIEPSASSGDETGVLTITAGENDASGAPTMEDTRMALSQIPHSDKTR